MILYACWHCVISRSSNLFAGTAINESFFVFLFLCKKKKMENGNMGCRVGEDLRPKTMGHVGMYAEIGI